jgi:hypothetical protein
VPVKLKNISGADLSCPYVPGEHVEAGATVEVDDDLDVIWPAEYWEPVAEKKSQKKDKADKADGEEQ